MPYRYPATLELGQLIMDLPAALYTDPRQSSTAPEELILATIHFSSPWIDAERLYLASRFPATEVIDVIRRWGDIIARDYVEVQESLPLQRMRLQ